jgi:hypothetical protein
VVLLPEEQLPDCSQQIRTEAAGTSLDAEIDNVIAAILVSRFSGRTVPEICAPWVAPAPLRQPQARATGPENRAQPLGSLGALEALADALLDFQGPGGSAGLAESQRQPFHPLLALAGESRLRSCRTTWR